MKGKVLSFFDSFVTLRVVTTVENYEKTFNKVVSGMRNIFKKDNKITLLKWRFSRKSYSKLKKVN